LKLFVEYPVSEFYTFADAKRLVNIGKRFTHQSNVDMRDVRVGFSLDGYSKQFDGMVT
jgi:hypothetical protein